jgi:hypothetical protein
MRRRGGALIGAVAVLLLAGLVGCGGSGGGGVPTAGGSATPSPSASDSYAQSVKFAECMRGHGVPQFPDPDPSGGGSLTAGSGVDRDSTEYQKAIKACHDLLPGGTAAKSADPEQIQQMTKFAGCMRAHGMPDFPDPGPDGYQAGDLDTKDPAYPAASEACKQYLTWR